MLEYDSDASDKLDTFDTRHGDAFVRLRPVHAPPRRAAHQRRPSAGAVTTPTITSASSMSPIRVAQTGTPRTKFMVPSIGSITQHRWLDPEWPNSSPNMASRGRDRLSTLRKDSSTARCPLSPAHQLDPGPRGYAAGGAVSPAARSPPGRHARLPSHRARRRLPGDCILVGTARSRRRTPGTPTRRGLQRYALGR